MSAASEKLKAKLARDGWCIVADVISREMAADTHDEELEYQGHWKGQPIGAEKAMREFLGAAAKRSVSPA